MIESAWRTDKSKAGQERQAWLARADPNLKPHFALPHSLLINPPSIPADRPPCSCIFKEPHQTIKTAMAQLLFTAKLGKVRGAGSSILVIGGEAILTASTAKDREYSDMPTHLECYGSGKRGLGLEMKRRARWAFVYRGHEKLHSRHFWGMTS
jgi:hypothetical protein